ncbi:hypothetical protein SAMN04515668_3514 [Hymenobacter arizonensis]|uniref:Uncharacterized protein n=1 Tax=Hymenobacter arizonensis TaxID=1227077 RepID=A0A1I6ABP7_HYMAR|nr:hypothetical protein SAMN04515668_3514 [Hymenobacter arizonensis]
MFEPQARTGVVALVERRPNKEYCDVRLSFNECNHPS